MNTRQIQNLAIEGKAPNQCPSCLSFRVDDSPILHTDDCERRSHRLYEFSEGRADYYLSLENRGITDEWYE